MKRAPKPRKIQQIETCNKNFAPQIIAPGSRADEKWLNIENRVGYSVPMSYVPKDNILIFQKDGAIWVS